ncbi:MAG: glycosyltransferase family 2 protein [bacterium]|jgi:SAM-dependent methyltransferase|nr:glycosyltransferase family 2 protein [bacterium]
MQTLNDERSPAPAGEHVDEQQVDLSVVIPCLNESRTVGGCVRAALDGIRASGLRGEVLVADNGSTDGSREVAERAGARVVPVPQRGYGAALQAGFRAARGRLMVMGDADLSYDFREIPKFVHQQRLTGADMVVGDRLHGGIDEGAMPWTHHHIGNPLISFTIRRLFDVPLNDCYCGLRMITREGFDRLRLNASSMVFALEMIVQGRLVGLTFAQVPITLHVDGRDHAPHLRTMRDGYRSFRFIFQHAPITAYLVPGVLAAIAGLVLLGFELRSELGGSAASTSMLAGGTQLLLLGWLVVVLGVIARVFVIGFLDNDVDPPLRRFFRYFRLETAVGLSALTLAVGLAVGIAFRAVPALLQFGLALCVVGLGTVVAAFVVSLIGRAIPDDRLGAAAEVAPASHAAPPLAGKAAAGACEQPAPEEDAALREARLEARRYRDWMVDALGDAWSRGSRVLTLDPTGAFQGLVTDPGGAGRTEMVVADVAGTGALDPAERFDSVLIFGALATVDDDVGALRSLAAHLGPGGRLGLLLPGGGDRLYGPIDRRAGRLRRYRPARLRQRLQMAGLEPVSIRWIDAGGALAWFCKARLGRASRVSAQDIQRYEQAVPLLRRLDALTGPPFGRLVAAIAQAPGSEPVPVEAGTGSEQGLG